MQEQIIPTNPEDAEAQVPVEPETDVIQGINATIEIGETTTLAPGSAATVTNSGTPTHAKLDFGIPEGERGETGPRGPQGETGESATIQMNATATTLSAGSQATATITNSGDSHNANYTLALGIPQGIQGERGVQGERGERGERGEQGIQGIQGIQGETGEAFSIYKTYPSVADMNADASNVPEGKFTLIASNVDDPDNSKLFVKNGEGTFTYLTDMSGAQGIQGERGEQGVQGIQGIQGIQGETGPRGSVKSQYVTELPASGDEDTFYLVDRDLESHTESGEYITLETTQTASAIQSAQIDGNATQTTYSGKNLWNGAEPLAVTSYDTYALAKPLPAGTYTLSASSITTTGTGAYSLVMFLDSANQTVASNSVVYSTKQRSFTLTGEATQVRIYSQGGYQQSQGVTTTFTKLQLESGNTVTPYEPYVGGTPAPNPEYPQPISVVTGENVVKVVGKNLLPTYVGLRTAESSGAELRYDSDGDKVILNADYSGQTASAGQQIEITTGDIRRWAWTTLDALATAPDRRITPNGGEYTVSMRVSSGEWSGNTTGSVILVIGISDDSTGDIRLANKTVVTTSTPGPYNVTQNISLGGNEHIRNIAFYAQNTTFDNAELTVQVEKGSTTAYEPYSKQTYTIDLGSLELCKLGTYQDRIYKDGEKWYVEKNTFSKTFDGSESWGIQGTRTHTFYSPLPATSMTGRCDHFTGISSSGFDVTEGCYLTNSNRFIVSFPSMNSVDDLKAWLATNPTKIVCGVAPASSLHTITEITNQTLIDQLEALASASLNQGVNNIWIEIATGNAMPTLELNWVEWEKYNRHNVYIWNDDVEDWQVIVGAGA